MGDPPTWYDEVCRTIHTAIYDNSDIPLDRRMFLRWLSRWWRGQHEFGVSEF